MTQTIFVTQITKVQFKILQIIFIIECFIIDIVSLKRKIKITIINHPNGISIVQSIGFDIEH